MVKLVNGETCKIGTVQIGDRSPLHFSPTTEEIGMTFGNQIELDRLTGFLKDRSSRGI